MKKLEDMRLAEILSQTGICLARRSLYDIWKDSSKDIPVQKTETNPEGKHALEILYSGNYADEFSQDTKKLGRFLFEHEEEIDKIKLVMTLLRNYKEALTNNNLSSEIAEEYKKFLDTARKLLKGIDKTFVYYTWEDAIGRIEQLIITDTKSEFEGKSRARKLKNIERLAALEREENLGNIVQALLTTDIEYVITNKREVGTELRFMIEYNSLLNTVNGDYKFLSKLFQKEGFDRLVAQTDGACFVDEMTTRIREYIEEIDIDKMLLCAGIRYVEGIESERINKKDAPELYRRLQVIQKHLKKNAELFFDTGDNDGVSYSTRDLERDMQRFIREGDTIKHLPLAKCRDIKTKIITGEVSLNDISVEIYQALLFTPQLISDILKKMPNNYIFFLRQNKCPYDKNIILKDIIDAKQCSSVLLQLLCEKTHITVDEICDLFDKGIISAGDLKRVRAQMGQIISNEKMFEKYQAYKAKRNNQEEVEQAKTQLERYALAYRNTELIGKTNKEQEDKGEEFIDEVGDRIESSDLVPLYGLDIIPLKVAVDWGGKKIIEQLLRNEKLKPADARYLRDNGLLDAKDLEDLFKNNVNLSYAYQVALVSTIFNGQTPEEQEARKKLEQYYHIENVMGSSSKKLGSGRRKATRGDNNEVKTNVKMRDPGAKYNLLSVLDPDTKIEEGIIDGHIIFHYPNIEDGIVLIEKLHKTRINKETGLVEIKADNEAATYIMSEEEFIKIKSLLIKDGKVDRTELTQRWWVTRDPEHWIPHTGISGWEKALKERFEINAENTRYSPEDLAKIEDLITMSIESKRGEDR